MPRTEEINMKTNTNAVATTVLILVLATATSALAVPGDKTELGFINRSSLVDAFNELKGFTVIDGYKTEDEKGFTISASAKKAGKNYRVRAWVSKDWTKGRIISIEAE